MDEVKDILKDCLERTERIDSTGADNSSGRSGQSSSGQSIITSVQRAEANFRSKPPKLAFIGMGLHQIMNGLEITYLDECVAVGVPEVELACGIGEMYEQLYQFNPLDESQSFGLDIYLQVVSFLTGLFER